MAARARIALVTAREALALDEDLAPLIEAFAAAGADAEPCCWDDAAIDWSGYSLALLRSTWDYVPRLGEFLAWGERASRSTTLLNPLEVVRWNVDKHYLLELDRAGVPVVPTRFVEPGEDALAALARFVEGRPLVPGTGAAAAAQPPRELVVKPAVGAGSKDAARYRAHELDDAAAHLARLLSEGRSAMLQPYLADVDQHGETAMVYLDGRYSHAIRKGPLLCAGAGLVEGLFAAEDISAREPGKDEGRVAKAAFNAIPFATPLYARVDLVRDATGSPVVLELELTEPSLFFAFAPGAAARYVEAALARLTPPG
jgi:O-ureido-D-serine cyclo-ligase